MSKFSLKSMLILALFGFSAFMVSCDKEVLNTEDLEGTENFVNQSVFEMQKVGNFGKFGCYEFVFPITVDFPDESTAEVTSYEELRTTVTTWKESNIAAEERPHLAFPIEVISEEGAITSVEDFSALGALKAACAKKFFENVNWEDIKGCKPDGIRGGKPPWAGSGRPAGVGGGRPAGVGGPPSGIGSKPEGIPGGKPGCMDGDLCFRLSYPVTIDYPDGSSETHDTHISLKQSVRAYRMDNQDNESRPQLAFPLSIEMEDGTIQSVDSQEALKEFKDSCGGN